MELSKNYIPAETEEKWNAHWLQQRYFNSQPDERPPFTVVIPPPNVTGVLHMGHVLNGTVQDILVRKARMSGYNACWVPGSDHASIATEARVVKMLKDQGIDKNQLTRPEFMKYAYEWKDKYGGIIYSQIRKLGCSVDWDRVAFTMDPDYYASVIHIFIELYKDGLIYRGARMINWDPLARTALSDEEVEYKEEQGTLYYVQYKIVNADGTPDTDTKTPLVIATQRPETIMGDTAVCVNPTDERYLGLAGKFAVIPLVNRRVPVIFDEYVDPAFGTGALKVTPAHDINDYNLGLKHGLPIIDTLNADGTLSAAAEVFVGMERFAARKAVVEKLRQEGLLVKEETHMTRIGFSQRTSCVVEPRISTQWFVKMKDLAEPALKAVTEGHIRIHPGDKFLATYKYWLENVKDWCISRQLWWGQQIPAWYAPDGAFQVAASREEAYKLFKAPSFTIDELKQDEDVLDTWFSSWLWPIEVFKGVTNPGNPDISYYYPTSVLVTGQDIIFFWVARMIMAGLYFYKDDTPMEKRIPFRDVYFTGMVRDKQGRKMSKSLGNSPDVLELMDKYGADALRFGIMISSPAGNDLLYDESSLEQGRNFNNKMWNALKLVKGWEGRQKDANALSSDASFAVKWFEHRLREARADIEQLYKEFRLSEALKVLYSLIWDDFCSWYLEWVKPGFEQPIDAVVYRHTIDFFGQLMQLLHPFMPFVTEEVYHLLSQRTDDLCVRPYATIEKPDTAVLAQGTLLKEAITAIRDARNKAQIKPKESIDLSIQSGQGKSYEEVRSILVRQVNAKTAVLTQEMVPGALTVVSGKDKFYIATEKGMDTGHQKDELQKELTYLRGFLESVDKKLGNERFVQNAKPEVVAIERKKREDAVAKIKTIEESLAHIG
ncbi:MAG: valine--tRNA ligase [Sphingobacteriales bacterium 50-39]|nr:valine--tRNA ligase [Sphingobacteriales bacterium]OJW53576.1 MAG: valine--tRNA ligase [Sphingobacteriales bacterium 50-39]